jgi:hypothetical protein
VSLPAGPLGAAVELLARLRVASLERLQRELVRKDPTMTRGRLVGELRAAVGMVSWFGDSIVCIRELG